MAPRLAPLLGIALGPMDLVLSTGLAMGAGLGPDIDGARVTDRDGDEDEGTKYGAIAVETHGAAGHVAGGLVARACGGHRKATHWLATGAAAGWITGALAAGRPAGSLAVAVAVPGAWALNVALPNAWARKGVAGPLRPFLGRQLARSAGWEAAPYVPAALGLAAAVALWLCWSGPVVWLGWAIGFGWTAHILEDWVCRTRGGGVPLFGIPLPPWWREKPGRRGRLYRFTRRRYELGAIKIDGTAEHVIGWLAMCATPCLLLLHLLTNPTT